MAANGSIEGLHKVDQVQAVALLGIHHGHTWRFRPLRGGVRALKKGYNNPHERCRKRDPYLFHVDGRRPDNRVENAQCGEISKYDAA